MIAFGGRALAQRVQFSQPAVTNTAQLPGSGTRNPAPPLTPNNFNQLAPVAQPPAQTVPGGSGLQPPAFDPYGGQSAAIAPALTAPSAAQPYYAQPPASPGYPGYPTQPPAQFPGGLPAFGNNLLAQPVGPGPYLKAIRDLRFRYTWIEGDPLSNGLDLEINDLELAVTFSLPNFLHSGEPLNISPGFIFHWWAGPSAAIPTADLPSRAYSTYLEFDWITNQQRRFGGEADFAVGVYSDYAKVNSNSLRYTGTGLGWFRITDTLTVKGGVEYLHRVDLKLLPAGGLFWNPNEDVRWEIYFPRPKLSQRLTTLGNTDVWWYVGAEYGGGSWTVKRSRGALAGATDQVDINDIRLFGGLEWFSRLATIQGFVEAGWVTKRELFYRLDPASNVDLEDSFMLRGGLAF